MTDVPPEDPLPLADSDLDARLASCMQSYRLFSLDPDVVLATAAELLADVAPGAEVTTFALHRLGLPTTLDLPPAHREQIDEAVTARAPAVSADGLCLVQPLLVRHTATDVGPAAAPKVVGLAVLESAVPLPPAVTARVAALADRAAVALEHALLYEVQAQIAQQLQRRLLPREQPALLGVETGVKFCPRTKGAEIGGDFIDFLSLSPNHLAVILGDVAGKGIAAAAVTVIAKYALRAITATLSWPTRPGEALRDLHNALQGQLDRDSFVTVVFGLIDVTRHTLSVASAGHPAPYLIHDGLAQQPLIVAAPAIALVDYSEVEPLPTERLPLSPGDTVLFFTDGLSELRDGDGRFYEEERLPQALTEMAALPPDRLVEELHADALAFAGHPPHDDIALVAVRLTA